MVLDGGGKKDLEAPIIGRHCLTSSIAMMAATSNCSRHTGCQLSAMFSLLALPTRDNVADLSIFVAFKDKGYKCETIRWVRE